MHDAEEIAVHVTRSEGATIVRPAGEIDLGRAPSLRHHLQNAQKHPGRLIVDLSEVPYMDSSGVATLIETMQLARRSGKQLVLCCMQDKVRSIFEIAKLDTVFTIVADVDTAVNA